MSDPRGVLERELERIAPPPFTLETFHERRERAVRHRRIAAGIAGIAVAVAGLYVGLRLFASSIAPVPASPIGAGAVVSLDPSGVVMTSPGGSRTILSPDDLAATCPEGVRCGFLPMLTWSPDGAQLAFAFGDTETTPRTYAALFVANADGSDPRQISDCVPGGGDVHACTDLAWSPVGSQVAWVAMGHVWVADLGSGEVRDLVGPSGCAGCAVATASQIAWSADGARIAYVRNGGRQIGVVAADGSSASVLIDELPRGQLVSEPSWSPDGASLLFASRPWHSEDPPGLWVRDLATGATSMVAEGRAPLRMQGGMWSPDSDWIAWRMGDLSLWIAHADGSQARDVYRVTSADDLTVFDGPWFSPDGRALLFQAPTADPRAPQTLVVPLDGGQPQPVAGWSATWGQGST